jgi:hypothetical protein
VHRFREDFDSPPKKTPRRCGKRPAPSPAASSPHAQPHNHLVRLPPRTQVMAIMRLKQWAFDRAALRHGRTANIEHSGWRERRMREQDSRQVRVIDFERALSCLDPVHQQMLLLYLPRRTPPRPSRRHARLQCPHNLRPTPRRPPPPSRHPRPPRFALTTS